MSEASRFVADAAVSLTVHTRHFFDWHFAHAETIASTRKAIAESRTLIADLDALLHDRRPLPSRRRWQTVASAPRNQDIEVCVMDGGEAHVLVGACRLTDGGWIDAASRLLEIWPTHWRTALA